MLMYVYRTNCRFVNCVCVCVYLCCVHVFTRCVFAVFQLYRASVLFEMIRHETQHSTDYKLSLFDLQTSSYQALQRVLVSLGELTVLPLPLSCYSEPLSFSLSLCSLAMHRPSPDVRACLCVLLLFVLLRLLLKFISCVTSKAGTTRRWPSQREGERVPSPISSSNARKEVSRHRALTLTSP